MADWLLLTVVVAAVITTMAAVYRHNTKGMVLRSEAMSAMAARHGIGIITEPNEEDFIATIHRSGYLKKGTSRELRNLMTIERPAYKLQVFDLRFMYATNDPGKSTSVSEWMTPFAVQFNDLDLPNFSLSIRMPINPKNRSGQDVIELPHDPKFSRKFIVTADDPQAVSVLFTEEVREFFRSNPFWSVSASGKDLLMSYGNSCHVRSMEQHLARVEHLASTLVRAMDTIQGSTIPTSSPP